MFYIISFTAAGVVGAEVPLDVVLFKKIQKRQGRRIKFAAMIDGAVHIQKNGFNGCLFVKFVHKIYTS